ncbi:hypothetical protein [Thioclava sp. GXIMD4216]|uniref:Uncharacterized protein n=1 Tax=Thioclava litoralis TaxID=3076557 RepID=A0ABZ1DZU6_9RHOB|nr:hypothetical protein RPE78_13395 [Thioclava sp. FTW29]
MTYGFKIAIMPESGGIDTPVMGGINQPGYGQRSRFESLRSAELKNRSVEAIIRAETTHAKVLADTLHAQMRTVEMWQTHLDRLLRRREISQNETLCPILESEIRKISARLEKAVDRLKLAQDAIATHGPDIAARIEHWRAMASPEV